MEFPNVIHDPDSNPLERTYVDTFVSKGGGSFH